MYTTLPPLKSLGNQSGQLIFVQWLLDKVSGPRFDCHFQLGLSSDRRYHDNACLRICLNDFIDSGDSIFDRHDNIEKYQIRLFGFKQVDGFLPVRQLQ